MRLNAWHVGAVEAPPGVQIESAGHSFVSLQGCPSATTFWQEDRFTFNLGSDAQTCPVAQLPSSLQVSPSPTRAAHLPALHPSVPWQNKADAHMPPSGWRSSQVPAPTSARMQVSPLAHSSFTHGCPRAGGALQVLVMLLHSVPGAQGRPLLSQVMST